MEKRSEFSYCFDLPDKDFSTWVRKPLTVRIMEDAEHHLHFEITIPKHIYMKVLNTEQQYKDEYLKESHISPVLNRKIKFRNKLHYELFTDLLVAIKRISNDAMQVHLVQESEKDKVIFIRFNYDHKDEVDGWNHAQMGLKQTSVFQYFICYRRVIKDHFADTKTVTIYESLEPDIIYTKYNKAGYGFKNYSRNRDWNKEFSIIEWTPEREKFLADVEQGFIQLNTKLEKYLSNLTEKKIELLMQSRQKLLESGRK